MMVRKHRGGYRESMATAQNIEPTFDALVAYFKSENGGILCTDITTIKVEPYGGVDLRNGWDTHIVSGDHGVMGFSDGPLENPYAQHDR